MPRLLPSFVLPLVGSFLASVVLAAPVAGAVPSSRDARPLPRASTPTVAKADTDRDGVFDDLRARLGRTAAHERVDVIVSTRGRPTTARLASLTRTAGAFPVARRFSVIDAVAASLTPRQIDALARHPDVLRVEEDSRVQATNDTAASSFGAAQARTDAGVDGDGDGQPESYSASDLVAAVIDTGIDAGHLDLDEGKVLAFQDFVNGRTVAYDDNGHGTHVAATIAGEGDARADGRYRGVAPGAALIGLKVLAADGGGSMSAVTAAIDWAVTNKDRYGIDVLNLSLGTSGCADGTDATSLAVDRAHAAGLVVAVAAGNSGPGTCTIGSPGAARGALTVGAMADLGVGGFGQASFSSRGPTLDGRVKPDVSAAGVSVTSAAANTSTGYAEMSGTSMATPFVAGVALLMLDAAPSLGSQAVKDTVTRTAIDWGRGGNGRTAGTSGPDIDYGAGRLDAYAAVESAAAREIGSGPVMPHHLLREGTLSATGARVDYALDVADTAMPVAATLIIPSISGAGASSPDFDVLLFDPAGTLVAAAETTARQERIGFRAATTGRYTLRVSSWSGSGGYFVDLSFGGDRTPPTVTGTSPASGATGVAPSANVTVTFSEAMDASATQRAFSLVRASDGASVTGAYRWSGTTLTFDPSADLLSSTTYRATVGTGARDATGNALASAQTWSFTVRPPTTVTVHPGSTKIESGSRRAGSASDLAVDDDRTYQVDSNTSSTRTAAWYGSFSGVSNALSRLKMSVRTRTSATCNQTIAIWRWTTSSWVQLDGRSLGTAETLIADLAPTGALADYVSGTSGDGEVRVRLVCTRTSSTFFTSTDLLRVVFDRP